MQAQYQYNIDSAQNHKSGLYQMEEEQNEEVVKDDNNDIECKICGYDYDSWKKSRKFNN